MMKLPGRSAGVRGAFWAVAAMVLVQAVVLGQPLQSVVNALVDRADLGGASVGVYIVEVETGQVLARRSETRGFLPASNMKLLTTGSALITLGDDFKFRTVFEHDGRRLIVRGSGDPALGDPAILGLAAEPMTPDALLGAIAGAVAARGVSAVDEVVVDDRVFGRQFAHPTWPVEQLNRSYSAEVGGLNFHANVLTVFADPGAGDAGSRPILSVEPEAGWIEVENQATVVGKGRNTIWVARPVPANRFTMYGNLRSRGSVDVSLHNPPEFAGMLVAQALLGAGVTVGGASGPGELDAALQRVRLVSEGEALAKGEELVEVRTALRDVLRHCNVESQNLYAEALLKRIGHEATGESGTWSNGAAVMRMLIADRVGAEAAAAVRIADGSGLSRGNLITPEVMGLWLRSLANDPATREPFLASLPRPGEGTLRNRFGGVRIDTEVMGKSGYISGVYSLSGYVRDPETGRCVAYTVLVNDVPAGRYGANAKKLHEQIVDAVDDYLAAAASPVKVGG